MENDFKITEATVWPDGTGDYLLKLGWELPCNCHCHADPSIMHFVACCNNRLIKREHTFKLSQVIAIANKTMAFTQ